jgi:alkaline phosphatase
MFIYFRDHESTMNFNKNDDDKKSKPADEPQTKELEKIAKKTDEPSRKEVEKIDEEVREDPSKIESKQETMTLVAYRDNRGKVEKVKSARGDEYRVQEIQEFIRSGALRVVVNVDGREVEVTSTGVGLAAMEGTTDLIPKLATY